MHFRLSAVQTSSQCKSRPSLACNKVSACCGRVRVRAVLTFWKQSEYRGTPRSTATTKVPDLEQKRVLQCTRSVCTLASCSSSFVGSCLKKSWIKRCKSEASLTRQCRSKLSDGTGAAPLPGLALELPGPPQQHFLPPHLGQ